MLFALKDTTVEAIYPKEQEHKNSNMSKPHARHVVVAGSRERFQ